LSKKCSKTIIISKLDFRFNLNCLPRALLLFNRFKGRLHSTCNNNYF
jgi:hypothetical protein